MNKGIIMLTLAVVLAAMVLIVVNKPGPDSASESSTTAVRSGLSSTGDAARAAADSGGTRPAGPPAADSNAAKTAPSAPPPPLPKVEPPVSTSADNGSAKTGGPATQGSGQNGTPAKTGTGFFTIPPVSQAAETATGKSRSPSVQPDSRLEKKTMVMPKKETGPQNGQKVVETEIKNSKAERIAATKGLHTAKAVALRFAGQGMVLRIEADGPFTVKTSELPGPDRLVIDLAGEWKDLQSPAVPSNNLVKGVRLGRQPQAMRLVLDLNRALRSHQKVQISDTVTEIHLQ